MGLLNGLVNGVAQAMGMGRIDRLCQQLGWSIDERNDDCVTLNFKCPVVGTRAVHIATGDDALVLFITSSYAVFDSRNMPDFVIAHALFRNSQTALGKWQMRIDRNDDLLLSHTYTALGDGLTAAALKYICTGMAEEARDFDAKMKEKGHLR